MKKTVLVAILLFCASARSQSPLALQYPFGLPETAVTGAAAALSGSGAAVAEEYFGSNLNPANIGIGGRSAFSALVTFERTSVSDGGASSAVSKYSPKTISLILPMGVAGNLGLAMQKRYEAGISFYTDTVLQNDADGYKSGKIELQNSGGLTAWQAGWGYRMKNGLSFGLMYERLFFNINSRNTFESTFKYEFPDPVTYRTSIREVTKGSFSSDGIRFGIQVPVHERVFAAAAAEYVFSSEDGRITREYTRSDAQTPIDDKHERDFSVKPPPSINIGLSYKPDDRWLIAADAQSTLWEMYKNDLGEADNLRRTYSVSAGGRFIPAANRLSAKYWEKILYCAGLRYSLLPIDESHEYSLSIGTGLPIPNEGGVIDLVLELGRRTDARYSNYSENTMKFQLGINGGRNWFQGTPK